MGLLQIIAPVVIVLLTITNTQACSCMPTHPQDMFCNSDFVILARVKRAITYNDTTVFKIRIRKEFKELSEKALVAMKSGRIITSSQPSTCGIVLEPGKKYVIGGNIHSLQPRVNLCGLHMDWDHLSPRQKKGFNRYYREGCKCRVVKCWRPKCARKINACNWTHTCQTSHGYCLPKGNNKCEWVKNQAQRKCMPFTKRDYLPFLSGPDRKFVQ